MHLLKRRTPRPGHEGFATDARAGIRGLAEQQHALTHAGSMAARGRRVAPGYACVAGLDDALAQLVVFAYESGLVSPGHAG